MVTRAANLTHGEGARPDLIFELLQVLAVCLHGTSESSEGDAQSSRATPLKGDSRRYLSEDFAFCRRWRDMGGKVYVDLNSKLQHAGQHLYRGDLIESLKLQDRW